MRYEKIQGLKGIAAIAIAYFFHYAVLLAENPFSGGFLKNSFFVIQRIGGYAPDLFFLISGFLMMHSYEKKLEKNKLNFREYIVPKVEKIYPLMIFTACVAFFLENVGYKVTGEYPLFATGGEIRYSWKALLLSVMGLQSGIFCDRDAMSVNGPSWFVTIIFLCYIIYYFLMRCCKTKKQIYITSLCIVCVGLFLVLFWWIIPFMPFFCLATGRGYMMFCGGVILYKIMESIPEHRYMLRTILSGIVLVMGLILFFKSGGYEELVLMLFVWPELLIIAFCTEGKKGILNTVPAQQLGNMSMSIFLCNLPTDIFINLCNKIFEWNLNYAKAEIWICHIVISLLIVWISHKIFEKRLPEFIKQHRFCGIYEK